MEGRACFAPMFVWNRLASSKWRDAWEERFLGSGQTNAVLTDLPGKKTFRLEVYVTTRAEADAIQKQFGGSVRKVKAENWAALAPPVSPPLRVRGRLVVTHTGDDAEAVKLRETESPVPVLQIPPEMAFGTGDHATTATCLRILCDDLDRRIRAGGTKPSVADFGTGTGILALASRLWGAAPVVAFDFDPVAVRIARANAKRNNVRGVTWAVADATSWAPPRTYDVVVANLFANVLVESMPILCRALAEDGTLIVSGILRDHFPDVEATARRHKFTLADIRVRGKWVTAAGGRIKARAKSPSRPTPRSSRTPSKS